MDVKWSLNQREFFGVIVYSSLLPIAIYIHSLELVTFSIAMVGMVVALPFSPIAIMVGQAFSGSSNLIVLNLFGCWITMFLMSWFSLTQIKGLALKNNETILSVLVRILRRSVVFVILIIAAAWWYLSP
jgi:hypothetical protein